LTISNTGTGSLTWMVLEEEVGPEGVLLTTLTEGFDDTNTLVSNGWYMQNNSAPVGTTGWFQGNSAVFSSQQGAPTSYIGANFNNTAGVGTISNWLLTPPITVKNGDTFSFWTRTVTSPAFADRLEVRLSTNGASTDVGTTATSVGDFTKLLLSINPDLTAGGYPNAWTQYSGTISGLFGPTEGRLGFRYFVSNAGPNGGNSDYIGIDTFEFVSGAPSICGDPGDVPWLSVSPASGAALAGMSDEVTVTFDATGLTPGDTLEANLCVFSNDASNFLVVVPVAMEVVPGIAPDASFTYHPSVPVVGEEVHFSNHSTGSEPITYEWDFGDGSPPISEKNPTHTYTKAGQYTVTLSAVNGFGTAEPVFVNAKITVVTRIYAPLLMRSQ
jgi:hypothetical protein